jgi:hypothetical protein
MPGKDNHIGFPLGRLGALLPPLSFFLFSPFFFLSFFTFLLSFVSFFFLSGLSGGRRKTMEAGHGGMTIVASGAGWARKWFAVR